MIPHRSPGPQLTAASAGENPGNDVPCEPREGVPLEGTMSVWPAHYLSKWNRVLDCPDGEPGRRIRLPESPKFQKRTIRPPRGTALSQRLSAPQLHGADFPEILRPRFRQIRSRSVELFEL